MPGGCGRRKLRLLYQPVAPPANQPVAPPKTRTSLSMKRLLSRGTNGNSAYTPFGLRMQALQHKIRDSLGGQSDVGRMSLWIGVLASGAVGLGTGFTISGWTAGSLWIVLGLAVVAAVAERGR